MLNTLFEVFEELLLIFGILILTTLIVSIIIAPFRAKREKEAKEEFLKQLNEIAKAQNKASKTTKKTTKKKDN